MNTVIAGDYLNSKVISNNRTAVIYYGPAKSLIINKKTVAHYDVADQSTKSGFSLGKAAIGAAAFGDIGVVAGVVGNQKSIYRLDISFRDGKRSLLEVDENTYKTISKVLFGVEDYIVEEKPAKNKPKARHENTEKLQNTEKSKPPILAKVLIFCVSVVVCVLIASLFSPVVDGVVQLNTVGIIFVFCTPVLLALLFPRSKK